MPCPACSTAVKWTGRLPEEVFLSAYTLKGFTNTIEVSTGQDKHPPGTLVFKSISRDSEDSSLTSYEFVSHRKPQDSLPRAEMSDLLETLGI